MNISWKEAILQAQKKIDQVLDIKEQVEEEELTETESVLPLETSSESVFTVEPTLPPVINNLLLGEDIQTIVSSDIEQLPRDCVSTPSPTEAFIEIHHEPENMAPNHDEMLYKTISVLKKELTEYKNANQMLIESNAHLERELEHSRFLGNQTMVEMLREEKSESEQDILIWKNKYTASQMENDRLSDALNIFSNYWKTARKQLRNCKNEMEIVKNTLKTGELSNEADMRRFGDLIEKFKNMSETSQTRKTKSTTNHWMEEANSSQSKITVENWTQTNNQEQEKERNERKKSERENVPEVVSNNVLPLLEIIEKLESEKQEMLTEQRKKDLEIRDLQNQLNQTLIMHGEKMEVLDELAIDNEDLRAIMKEQALMLTKM